MSAQAQGQTGESGEFVQSWLIEIDRPLRRRYDFRYLRGSPSAEKGEYVRAVSGQFPAGSCYSEALAKLLNCPFVLKA